MPSTEFWAGALSHLLIHAETGCPHSALNAARLLECQDDMAAIDGDTRNLCERASIWLGAAREVPNVCPVSDRRSSGKGKVTTQLFLYQEKTDCTNERAVDSC
ncbi:hypothetical protein [Candidatus Accumulibacter sp. ACC003]|uniref:hypothetical protein n=1 Tax=Candidatus Accumulibacter sp. ACC003 TaxID=2823334 RepID=UPI0025C3F2B1|nr:hypothetical protein [Candidatus Accumulibacter sp. ACC003]